MLYVSPFIVKSFHLSQQQRHAIENGFYNAVLQNFLEVQLNFDQLFLFIRKV